MWAPNRTKTGRNARRGRENATKTIGQPKASARNGPRRFPKAAPAGGEDRNSPIARPGVSEKARETRNTEGTKMNATGIPARNRKESIASYRGSDVRAMPRMTSTRDETTTTRRGAPRSIKYPAGIWKSRMAARDRG